MKVGIYINTGLLEYISSKKRNRVIHQ